MLTTSREIVSFQQFLAPFFVWWLSRWKWYLPINPAWNCYTAELPDRFQFFLSNNFHLLGFIDVTFICYLCTILITACHFSRSESDITNFEQHHLADLITTWTTHCPPRKLQTNWTTRNYRCDFSAVQNSGEIRNYKLGWAVDLARLPLFWKPLGQCTALHLPIYTTLRSTFTSYVIKKPRSQLTMHKPKY